MAEIERPQRDSKGFSALLGDARREDNRELSDGQVPPSVTEREAPAPSLGADPIAAALDEALGAWRVGGDRRRLRRALLRVLAEIDEGPEP